MDGIEDITGDRGKIRRQQLLDDYQCRTLTKQRDELAKGKEESDQKVQAMQPMPLPMASNSRRCPGEDRGRQRARIADAKATLNSSRRNWTMQRQSMRTDWQSSRKERPLMRRGAAEFAAGAGSTGTDPAGRRRAGHVPPAGDQGWNGYNRLLENIKWMEDNPWTHRGPNMMNGS